MAVDFSECSKKALNWAIDNVVREGDYLILITVCHDMHYEEGEMQLWETVGSRTLLIFSLLLSACMRDRTRDPCRFRVSDSTCLSLF